MQPITSKRFYTPQFSALASISVKRLAWALKKDMTEAVDIIIQLLPYIMDYKKICNACQDNSICDSCAFHNPQLSEEEQLNILAAL